MGGQLIRPEVRAALWRWREALGGACVMALGLWAMLTSFGVLYWLGWVAILLGGAVALSGVQTGRFRRGGGGAGVVTIVEGQITYFGPESGGTLALDLMTAIEIGRSGDAPLWLLHGRDEGPLAIPVRAVGADALLGVFASLSGFRTGAALGPLADPPDPPVTIWRRAGTRPAPLIPAPGARH